jgi:hypothetical protein
MSDEYNHNGIGRMVAGLQATVNAFQENWRIQDQRAADGRKMLYDKVEGFGNKVMELSNRVDTVVSDVAEMKPAVTDWVASKHRAEGASWAVKVVWIGGGAMFGVICFGIDHFLIK